MQSAYSVLGVPGNASRADIDEAFEKAQAHYSDQKITLDPQAAERFVDIKNAYRVLRDEESRAGHDRKLDASAGRSAHTPSTRRQTTPLVVEPHTSRISMWLQFIAVALILLVVSGFYFNSKKETARKERVALELKTQQLAAAEAEKEELRKTTDDTYRAKLAFINEQKDLQFRQESSHAISRARSAEIQNINQDAQRVNTEQREAQRKEYEAKTREQNAAREAQQRLAMDKARIRELCYQNYRRPDC